MAGIPAPGTPVEASQGTYLSNLALAAGKAGEVGRTVLIEPINSRDMPGFFLSRQDHARRIIETVKADNLRLQLDLYHCQIMHGDLATHVREYLGIARHIQIAGVPERHEPDVGEINYPYLFDLLDELGYDGFVGCEYRPRAGTLEGLGWLDAYRRSRGT